MIQLAQRQLHTKFGVFNEHLLEQGENRILVLSLGIIEGAQDVLCRVHSSCISAHTFNSIECDCLQQMSLAQSYIQSKGSGLIIWLDQEGRGNGHLALIQAARLAREKTITQTEAYVRLGYVADARNYQIVEKVLSFFGIESIILLTNNPKKQAEIEATGVLVNSRKAVFVPATGNPHLESYYQDKTLNGHNLTEDK